jgi:hypothetical protein
MNSKLLLVMVFLTIYSKSLASTLLSPYYSTYPFISMPLIAYFLIHRSLLPFKSAGWFSHLDMYILETVQPKWQLYCNQSTFAIQPQVYF